MSNTAAATAAAATTAAKLLTSRLENVGVITLNNPKALHALTQDMIDGFDHILKEWTSSNKNDTATSTATADAPGVVKAILIKAAPGAKRPAFCAGGDVKTLYHVGKQQQQSSSSAPKIKPPESYFYSEYQVNHAIATSNIPIVSLWDGVVMGGGAGISVHGTYRVATQHSMLAMPECAIGLFPDVGSLWWMTRLLQPSLATANWLALTGHRLYAHDLITTGLATHYVPSEQLEALEAALVTATTTTTTSETSSTTTTKDAVAQVLDSFHQQVPINEKSVLTKHHQEVIDQTFTADTVEGIVANLEQEGSDFSQAMLQILQKQSPTSLKLTLEGLCRATTLDSIGQDLQMEYRMAKACVATNTNDFYEGVRAALVDKDQQPKWNPSTLEEVTWESIEKYFAPLSSKEEEWVIPNSTTSSSTGASAISSSKL